MYILFIVQARVAKAHFFVSRFRGEVGKDTCWKVRLKMGIGWDHKPSCLHWCSHCFVGLISTCTSTGSMTLHWGTKLGKEKGCCLWWWSSRFAEVLKSLFARVLLLSSLNLCAEYNGLHSCFVLQLVCFMREKKTRSWIKTTKPLKSYSVSSIKFSGFVVQACLMLHIFSVKWVASLHNI